MKRATSKRLASVLFALAGCVLCVWSFVHAQAPAPTPLRTEKIEVGEDGKTYRVVTTIKTTEQRSEVKRSAITGKYVPADEDSYVFAPQDDMTMKEFAEVVRAAGMNISVGREEFDNLSKGARRHFKEPAVSDDEEEEAEAER